MRVLIACGLLGLLLAAPLAAQPAKPVPPIEDSAQIATKLLARIDIPERLDRLPLRDALTYLQDRTDLTFLLDAKALAAAADGGDPNTLGDQPITIPAMKNVRAETVLRLVADQINADFYIAPDHVRLTTPAAKDLVTGSARRLPELYPPPPAGLGGGDPGEPAGERSDVVRATPYLTASYRDTSAVDALRDLARRAGRTVVIAEGAAEKAKAPITVDLTNVAFETAAAGLAEAAGLRAFRAANVVVIVPADRAKLVDARAALTATATAADLMTPFCLGFGIDPADVAARAREMEERIIRDKIAELTARLEKLKKQ